MITTPSRPLQTDLNWGAAFRQSAQEFNSTQLTLIEGKIPVNLQGSFYRNGSGKLERAGEKIHHWCDGDGGILAVHFQNKTATGLYRYVQTEAYQIEEKAGKFSFGSYGRTPTGSIWSQLTLPVKNNANGGILALGDRLLALWEAGVPYSLDPITLETWGLDQVLGLEKDDPYATHPKRDLFTGDIYNFGVKFGTKGILYVYRSDASGKIQQRGKLSLEGLPLIHDFVLTKHYLIFIIPPVHLSLFPFLSKQKSFSDSLSWQPQRGTKILVVDRSDFQVISQAKTNPWFQWRFGHSYEDADGTVVIDLLRYSDFQINQYLRDVPQGNPQVSARGNLWQIRLDPKTAQVISQYPLLERTGEYPMVVDGEKTYLTLHSLQEKSALDFPRTIACLEHSSRKLREFDLGESFYPVSPIYAPDQNFSGKGWILTEVFNSQNHSSEFWIFDAEKLEQGAVCRLQLPHPIPIGFHGIWQPR